MTHIDPSTAPTSTRFAEITAFAATIADVDPTSPTRCPGWTAHDLLAHVVAGGDEMLRLIDDALDDAPPTPTRGFAEREAPLRRMDAPDLLDRMAVGGAALLTAIGALHERSPWARVAFTRADLTATQLMTHVRSELALHRWDLVGDDDIGRGFLAEPALLEHGRWVLSHMPDLEEARHRPADDHGDLLVLWGRRPTTVAAAPRA